MTIRDYRYAVRSLSRAPAFTAAAALTLALGIGAVTAVFSVVDALLLRPLPYKAPDRLVMVWDQLLKLGLDQFPAPFFHYFEYKQRNQVFEDIAAFSYDELNLASTPNAAPERIEAMAVSANYFPVLGVKPQLGRVFAQEENQPGRDDAIILSQSLWTRRFGGDRGLLGQTLRLNDRAMRVVGIMPADFRFTIRSGPPPDAWIPIAIRGAAARSEGTLRLVARLKPGTTLEQAKSNMAALASAMQAAYHPYTGPHGEDAGYRIAVVPLRDQLFGGLRTSVLMLFGAVALLLVIACVNITNLLLTRHSSRQGELAIRQSLGATRLRLARELSAEALVLGVTGGCLGIVLAKWSIRLLPALTVLPEQADFALDWRVLAFACGLILATAVLFGIAPALWKTSANLNDALRQSGPQSDRGAVARFRSVLVAIEAGLSVLLLACAGLLFKSFLKLEAVDPGFNPDKVLSMRVALPVSKYREPNQRAVFYERALERLRAIPGVRSAAAISQLPLSGGGRGGDPFSIEGRRYDPSGRVPQVVNFRIATADYFQLMQIPLIAGRVFSERDKADAPPIGVINETMARGFWSSPQEALGKHIVIGAPRPGAKWLTIAGVVGDVRNSGLRIQPIPQLYVPHSQNSAGAMVVVLRTAVDPLSVALDASRQIGAIDPDQPVYEIQTLEQKLTRATVRERFQAMLLAAFSVAALLLAAVGIYGVLAQSVARRIPEIGIRMALGAQPSDMLRFVVRQGMAPAVIGMAAGLACSVALMRALRSLLFGVSPTDVPALAGATALFTLVALIACYLPARRATRVDPMVALRYE